MSSTESSGAPAEASATTPAPSAAFPSFGSTRGSGLARGKRPSTGPVAAASAASTDYTPTAIEVVSSPREYQNPFAPVETPAAVTSAPAPAVASAPAAVVEVAPVKAYSAPARPEPVEQAPVQIETAVAAESDEPAELNILEPAQQKVTPAQTWESEGFRPARESRNDRPRREETRREERTERAPRQDSAPFDPSTIPAKFLYVRPGYNYVPTPSNYGGAPRERDNGAAAAPSYSAPVAATPEKSGGFLGWLKSLFGGSTPAPAAVESRPADQRNGDRHRGGRGRGGPGGGGDGQRRRSRGGRNRNRGEYRSGGDQGGNSGGPAAT